MKHANCLIFSLAVTVGSTAGAASLQLTLQDAKGKALGDAVVFLEARDAKAPVKPVKGTEIAQVDKQFTPRVTVVPVGSLVQFPNRDTVRHHVYSFSPTKTFELKLYAGKDASPVEFDKPGVAVLGCNIHDKMVAWVVVVDTPYFGKSGEAGHVTLDNVPAGNYRLRVWHPDMPADAGAMDQALALPASGSAQTISVTGLKR